MRPGDGKVGGYPVVLYSGLNLSLGSRDRVAMDTIVELAIDGLRHIIVETIGEAIGRLCGWVWRRVHGWVVRVTGLSELAIPVSILLIMALVAGAFVAVVKIAQAVVT